MSSLPSADDPSVKEERRRRLKAARAYAGLTVKELAAVIAGRGHARGYSAENINLMERRGPGGRAIHTRDIRVLAEACGVPPEFFTVDLSTLADDEGSPSVSEQLEELRAQQADDSIRLAQLEEAVQALAATGPAEAPRAGGQQ